LQLLPDGKADFKALPSKGHRSTQGDFMERRGFIQGMTAAGLLSSLGLHAVPTEVGKGGIPYRTLGRTGEKVSIIGMGGAHIGRGPTEQEAIQLIRSGIDRCINFMDNSWD